MKNYFTVRMSLEFRANWERFLEGQVVVDLAVDTEDLLFIFGDEGLSTSIYSGEI